MKWKQIEILKTYGYSLVTKTFDSMHNNMRIKFVFLLMILLNLKSAGSKIHKQTNTNNMFFVSAKKTVRHGT